MNKVLAVNDGSEEGFRAFRTALDFGRAGRAELHMVMVERVPLCPTTTGEVDEIRRTAEKRFDKIVGRAKQLARLKDVEFLPHLIVGDPTTALGEFMRPGQFDLLIVGFDERASFYNRIMGGKAERFVQMAPCSVLVVK